MEQQLLSVVAALALAFGCAPTAAGNVNPGAPDAERTNAPEVAAKAEPGAGSGPGEGSAESAPAGSPASPEPAATEPGDPPARDLPKDTLVLHVGDSFAGALGIPLGLRFKAAGLRTVLKFETASYVPGWASGKALGEYLEKYRPQLVLITLGANEIELANPEQRAGTVRRLIARLEGRPCVWIKPPLWKPDTGIFRVIAENAAPCRLLDTDALVQNLARKRDKIHPSDEANELWAEAVFTWLAREREPTDDRPWNLREGP